MRIGAGGTDHRLAFKAAMGGTSSYPHNRGRCQKLYYTIPPVPPLPRDCWRLVGPSNLATTMTDPNTAAAPATTTAGAQQVQGAAGRPKTADKPVDKVRMRQMLDEPEVQQELSKIVGGNSAALQAIIGILRAMTSSSDLNSDPKMVEQLKTHQVG